MEEDQRTADELIAQMRDDPSRRKEIAQQIRERGLAGPELQKIIDRYAARPTDERALREEAEFRRAVVESLEARAPAPQLAIEEQPSEALYRRMLARDEHAKQEFLRRCREQLARDVEALEEGRLDVDDPGPDPVVARFLRKVAEIRHLRELMEHSPHSGRVRHPRGPRRR